MYQEHFGLATNPFGLSPRLDFLYRSTAYEESIAHLIFGLNNAEAIVMITGPVGSGKSMAVQSFMSNLGGHVSSALVTNTQVTSIELLKLVLEDLGVRVPPGCDKSDLLILFKDYLLTAKQARQQVVIVIDEAQNLAREVLEEVRLLTNLGQGDEQPVQIILVGQPELEERVNSPGLAQLRQRIRVHYRLEPLTRREVGEYLNHRMAVAGCRTPVFDGEIVARIHSMSGGVPRIVNTLAGEALLAAYVDGRKVLKPGDVTYPDSRPLPEENEQHVKPAKVEAPYRRSGAEPARSPVGRVIWGVFAAVVVVAVVVLAGFRFDWWPRLQRSPSASAVPVSAVPDDGPERGAASGITDTEPGPAAPLVTTPASDVQGQEAVASAPSGASQEPEPPVTVPAETSDVADDGSWYIHVASYPEAARADNHRNQLLGRGVGVSVETVERRSRDWYRVYVGPFASEAAAQAVVRSLQADGGLDYHKIVQLDGAAVRQGG